MKQVSQKIISIIMAFVVVLSTVSFAVNSHYCGNTLVDTAVFYNVKTCKVPQQFKGCAVAKMNCCSNKQKVVDGQDELQLTIDKVSFGQQIFITSLIYTYINLFEDFDKSETSYQEYSQPLVIRQLYKIDETYLI